jgi:hypothetical protein
MNYNYVPSYPGATLLGIRDLSKRNQSLIKEEPVALNARVAPSLGLRNFNMFKSL